MLYRSRDQLYCPIITTSEQYKSTCVLRGHGGLQWNNEPSVEHHYWWSLRLKCVTTNSTKYFKITNFSDNKEKADSNSF